MGIYSRLEDTWYGFWEKTPLIGLIDAVDNVVPSLVLFLVIVLLLIAGGAYFLFFQNQSNENVKVFVTVLDSSGSPIEGANVKYVYSCSEQKYNVADVITKEVSTDQSGNASFSVCLVSGIVGTSATKEGYDVNAQNILLNGFNVNSVFTLSQSMQKLKFVSVSVVDESNSLILGATLDYSCTQNGKSKVSTVYTSLGSEVQGSESFNLNYNLDCITNTLTAKAPQYADKTVVLTGSSGQKTIKLVKVVNEGTVIFNADSPKGKQAGAIITVTNYLGLTQTLVTLTDGTISDVFDAGNYNYSALANGAIMTGSFTVIVDAVKEVKIYFSELNGNDSNLPNIYLKPVDENANSINFGQARIYYLVGADANFFRTVSENANGFIGPVEVFDYVTKSYKAVVSAPSYVKKIVSIDLKKVNEQPQIVSLNKGGRKLIAQVIDDQNQPLTNAVVQLFMQGFSGALEESRLTDKNGFIEFDGLPDGNYLVAAQTKEDYGQASASIVGQNLDVLVRLLTGKGQINFNFVGDNVLTSPKFELFQKSNNGFTLVPITAMINTKSVKLNSGSKINLKVNDLAYLPFESLVYPITRETANQNIYLRSKASLPNQNEIQLMLRKVLLSDPTTSPESPADKLAPGNNYYFYFDLIVNTTSKGNALVNSYFDSDDDLLFLDAKSINGSATILSGTKQNTVINSDIVETNAKQVNVILPEQSETKMVPVLVKISVDANAPLGLRKIIYFQASFGEKKSLLYSKEFVIGNTFCLDNCPDVLFSTFVMNQSNPENQVWVIADSSKINLIQIGALYKIKINANNLTDTDYKTVSLSAGVSDSDKFKLSFDNNLGTVSNNTTLGPLAKSADLTSALNPTAPSNNVQVNLSLNTPNTTTDPLVTAIGNNSKVRFSVKSKKNLYLGISNGTNSTINEKVNYPIFILSTYSKDLVTGSKNYLSAYWKATLKRNSTSSVIYSGRKTDANGIDVLSFNATGLNAGDIVEFDAWDEYNSNPAHLETTITNPFTIPEAAPDCINVSYQGTNGTVNVKDVQIPNFEINSTDKGKISIASTCTDTRKISVETELHAGPSGTNYSIAPGAVQEITIDCYGSSDRCETLGAFPVTIYSGTALPTKLIATIDVIIKDQNSPLELSDAIWNYRNNLAVVGKVTNKQYTGRKDLTMPLMTFNKPGVQIDYLKAGTSGTIDINLGQNPVSNLTLKVDTVSVEGIVTGLGLGDTFNTEAVMCGCDTPFSHMGLIFAEKGCIPSYCIFYNADGTPLKSGSTPLASTPVICYSNYCANEHSYYDLASAGQQVCNDVAQSVKNTSIVSRIAPDAPIRNPQISFDQLTNAEQAQIVSQITGQKQTTLSYADKNISTGVNLTEGPNFDSRWNEFYPNVIPKISYAEYFAGSGCYSFGYLQMGWRDNPEPPGIDHNKWFYFADNSFGAITGSAGPRDKQIKLSNTMATFFYDGWGYYGPGKIGGVIKICPPIDVASRNGIATNSATSNFSQIKTPFNEKTNSWSKEVQLEPIKGKVYNLGKYNNATAPLLWENTNVFAGGLDSFPIPIVDFYNYQGMHILNDLNVVRPVGLWINGYAATYLRTKNFVIAKNIALGQPEKNDELDLFVTYRMMGIDALDCSGHIIYKYDKNSFHNTGKYFFIELDPNNVTPEYRAMVNNPICKQIEIPAYSFTQPITSWAPLCSTPLGDVPLDAVKDFNFPLPDVNSTLVEYSPDGKSYSVIRPQDVPQGWRVFLKNGNLYAEYIGLYRGIDNNIVFDNQTAASPDIDFNAVKVGDVKSGYAILSVSDWVGGAKVTKKFQVKLIGSESNCVSSEGEDGLSGASVDLHLLYDWDFSRVDERQCDSLSVNYSYCDATQFSISLVKRLDKIMAAEISGDKAELANYSSGYNYLIKDNYSQSFLRDFDAQYSKFLNSYVPLRDRIGLNKLISEGRIKFVVRNGDNVTQSGTLPNGGIYFVGIDVNYDNLANKSFTNSDGTPNATITITFTLYKETGSTNPLYEMPFDGEVGKNNSGTYARADYGVGVNGNLVLNSNTDKAAVASNAFKNISIQNTTDLPTLNKGIVLSYNSNSINYSPSQPTPVMMTITSDGNTASGGYTINGAQGLIKNWTRIGSTINGGCYDFEGKRKTNYSETVTNNNHQISWTNPTQQGKINLTTTFYTQKTTNASQTEITPINQKTTLTSINTTNLNNGSALGLKYYDATTNTNKDYDTLQGMLNLIKKGEMCITKTPTNGQTKIWWNLNTTNKLEQNIPQPEGNTC